MTYVEWTEEVRVCVIDALPDSDFRADGSAYDAWKRGSSPEEYAKTWVVNQTQPKPSVVREPTSQSYYVRTWSNMVAYQGIAILSPFAGLAFIRATKSVAPIYFAALVAFVAGMAALVLGLRAVIVKRDVDDQICGWIVIGCNIISAFLWCGFLIGTWSGLAFMAESP